MGADYLEQDVVATKDDQLVVLHDIHLDRVTDVARQFPGRQRDDGRFYVRDFSLAEIRLLHVHDRTLADGSPVYPRRPLSSGEEFRVHTFSEELDYITELQASFGRPVGVYAEIKSPAWHRREGVDITPAFLKVLGDYGYDAHADPVYVQCFDDQELLRIREEHNCALKLVQLIGDNSWGEADTDFEELRSRKGLVRLARTVDGIGPWVNFLYRIDTDRNIVDSGLVSNAHQQGLAVHPFTFRDDDLPQGFETFAELLRFTVDQLCIDGLFTDFPDLAKDLLGHTAN
jgi:glycerophosphoryl diester phosphodiesterase